MIELFSYQFISRAVITGSLLSLCAALLGVGLVLKRYAMIGDGLSHIGFGALSIALAASFAPMAVAIPVVIIAAFFLLRISENGKIKGDTAIGLISGTALAVGLIATSLAKGVNIDVNSYLFGSIFAISARDMYLSGALSIMTILIFTIFYNAIFAVTFDESFAKATGVRTGGYNALIAVLAAATVTAGIKMMGAMLISSLIIFPATTAMYIFKSFRRVIISSAVLSIICFFLGVIASYTLALPVGASIVVINAIVFLLCAAIKRL